jgi:putative acyl-CoA dehydrogenase
MLLRIRNGNLLASRSLSTTAQTATIPSSLIGQPTHAVLNQSQPFQNINFLKSEKSIKESIEKMISSSNNQNNIKVDWNYLEEYGKKSGSAEMLEAGNVAEKNVPTLRQFDNYGRRIDVIDYHPAYHTIMNHGVTSGVCSYGFRNSGKPGSHITRGVMGFLENQIDSGHACPLTMTAAVIPVLLRAVSTLKKANSSNPVIQANISLL